MVQFFGFNQHFIKCVKYIVDFSRSNQTLMNLGTFSDCFSVSGRNTFHKINQLLQRIQKWLVKEGYKEENQQKYCACSEKLTQGNGLDLAG